MPLRCSRWQIFAPRFLKIPKGKEVESGGRRCKEGGRRRLVGGSGRHTFRDRMGEKTPLHFACCRGDPKAIIEALESGCNVNAADDVSPLAFQQLATAARECHSPGHLIIPAAARQLAPLDAALRAWRAGAEAGPFPNFSNLIGTGEVKKTHHRGHSTRPVHI